MSLEKISLPVYTQKEEMWNSISHGIGIPMGVAALVVLLMKAIAPSSILGASIFSLSIVILYTCSTLYHSLKPSNAKKFMRTIDHSVIFIMISGTTIPLALICVYPYAPIFAIASVLFSAIVSAVGIALTIIDQDKYRVAKMVLYMVVGWAASILVFPIYKYCDNALLIIGLIALGGVIYTVGTVFLKLGQTKKYFHAIFHGFVLVGTMLHIAAIYIAI